MIYKILEYDYKGFHLILDEEGGIGWKVVIGEQEIKFPHSQAAESAINEILSSANEAIARHNGTVIKKVLHSHVTKTVEQGDKLWG